MVDKVEKNYIMNSKVQEFYWNNEFIDYEEYKTNESILYSEDILENTFIFIRVDNLKKKVKSVSDPLGIEKAKAKKLAEEKKKKAEKEKKQKAANRAAKIKKNSNEEILKLNNANEKLNSLSKEISDIKSKINKLNLNNEKIVNFFDDVNTNYNDQKSKFFDLYKGYNGKIPDLLPTTDIPKGILELNNELYTKNNELKTIKTKASNDYKKAEKIQTDAATFLNNSKVKGIDISSSGSGNPGTSNALRTLGKGSAVIVLLGDLLKGALPIIFFYEDQYFLIYGVAAVLGHIYPVFYKFKGGKGVATYLGVYIATVLQNPYNSEFLNLDLFQLFNIPAIALFYFVLFKTTRISAIASLLTVALTAGLLMFANNGFLNILVLTFVFILILVKHSENIKRLIEGKENKF